MKKIILTLLILTIFSNCSKNDSEKRLIGTWNNYPSPNGVTEFRFYPDSIISFDNNLKRKGTWKAENNKIYFHFPNKLKGFREKFNYDYKIYLENDSLVLKDEKDTSYMLPTFFKVTDPWRHYLRELQMEIELPEADFEFSKNESMNSGIDIYLGYENDNFIVKTNDGFELKDSFNIKHLVLIMKSEKNIEEIDKLNFNLIVDKNVPQFKIDSMTSLLHQFPKMKIFRVYKNDSANYGIHDIENGEYYHWNWYGKFE